MTDELVLDVTIDELVLDQVGAQGPPGPTGASSGYKHIQGSPSSIWTIAHNLGYKPGGISIIDSAGSEVEGEIAWPDDNTLVATFTGSFSGEAYIS